MIARIPVLASVFAVLIAFATAEVAPPITTVIEGYNVIAKLPCVGCPFLYIDTKDGKDGGWTKRSDENALLLNISLPYITSSKAPSSLSINSGVILPHQTILPRIYATQILEDTSSSDLNDLISYNALESPNSATLGLSYRYDIRKLRKSHGLSLIFDIFEVRTDLLPEPMVHEMKDPKQKVLEIVLLEPPLLGAGDAAHSWEMVRAQLREPNDVEGGDDARVMRFQDWDAHGHKGTTSHMVNTASDSLLDYITSGVVGLLVFIMAIIALFVVICLFCIFGCGMGNDEYGSAQRGKRRTSKRGSGSWAGNDVEKAKGRFRSAEELGLRNGGKVVGLRKSD